MCVREFVLYEIKTFLNEPEIRLPVQKRRQYMNACM